MQNTKYCSLDGGELRDDDTCSKCNRKVTDYWEKELARRNPPGYHIADDKYYCVSPYIMNYYICHDCKYFMFHSLIYCPKCGKHLDKEKLYNTELLQKYSDYRQEY